MNKAKAVGALPEISDKVGQVLQVGKQLTEVSVQVDAVNQKLGDLDALIMNLNQVRNLVTQSLQEGRAVHEEQARQRFVTLKMFERLFVATGLHDDLAVLEEQFRDEFDATLRNTEETSSEEPA